MSLIQQKKECYICHTPNHLHKHHIFGGINRAKSEADGCTCYLCFLHHNGSTRSVHFDRNLDLMLKRECQRAYMSMYRATVEDFVARYGKSYL